MKNEFVKEYFSIPNIMGYFRIILVFVYMSFFYNSLQGGPYWPVIATIIVSGLTDFFDGKVARKFNMVTDFGKMLDPIADKITIGAIILTMAFKYKMIIYMVALYILKEGYMAIMGAILIGKGHKIEGAKWYGKVCTFVTYVILIILLLFPAMNTKVVWVLTIADMVLMIFTWINYIVYHKKILENI